VPHGGSSASAAINASDLQALPLLSYEAAQVKAVKT
jgi:hypothetical protein